MIRDRINRINVNLQRFGYANTIKYMLYNGLFKRLKNKANYILKNKRYPQNIVSYQNLRA